ncbi:glycosyltransferase family 2 protein, partial [Tsukamurella sputi]
MNLRSTRNVEVIVVDDGSTDMTPEVCDSLASDNEQVSTVHQPNGGLSSARNAGLRCAVGEWVWFVDSDDVVSPDSLSALTSMSKSCSNDLIAFDVKAFSEGSEIDWQSSARWDEDVSRRSSEAFIDSILRGERQHYV